MREGEQPFRGTKIWNFLRDFFSLPRKLMNRGLRRFDNWPWISCWRISTQFHLKNLARSSICDNVWNLILTTTKLAISLSTFKPKTTWSNLIFLLIQCSYTNHSHCWIFLSGLKVNLPVMKLVFKIILISKKNEIFSDKI